MRFAVKILLRPALSKSFLNPCHGLVLHSKRRKSSGEQQHGGLARGKMTEDVASGQSFQKERQQCLDQPGSSEFTQGPFLEAQNPHTSDIRLRIREQGYKPAEILNMLVCICGSGSFVWS